MVDESLHHVERDRQPPVIVAGGGEAVVDRHVDGVTSDPPGQGRLS